MRGAPSLFDARDSRLGDCCHADASREMATTTWLIAFEGTELVLPGIATSCHRSSHVDTPPPGSAPGSTSAPAGWLRAVTLRRPASAQALSTFLLILRYLVQGVAGLVYLGVRRRAGLRLGMLLVAAALSSGCGLCLLWGGKQWRCGDERGGDRRRPSRAASQGGVAAAAEDATAPDEEAPTRATESMPFIMRSCWPTAAQSSWPCTSSGGGGGEDGHSFSLGCRDGHLSSAAVADDSGGSTDLAKDLVLWPWQLTRWELSLTFFLIVARGVPAQSSDTMLAYFSSSAAVPNTLAAAFDGGSTSAREMAEMLLAPVCLRTWHTAHAHSLSTAPATSPTAAAAAAAAAIAYSTDR